MWGKILSGWLQTPRFTNPEQVKQCLRIVFDGEDHVVWPGIAGNRNGRKHLILLREGLSLSLT
ncbi:hypothetical protein RCH11_002980 [Glaciihabitans sp. GrIS 2.15]|nr:hypothetical protein [Glaciihabitans sp. GrIS 2.15]